MEKHSTSSTYKMLIILGFVTFTIFQQVTDPNVSPCKIFVDFLLPLHLASARFPLN